MSPANLWSALWPLLVGVALMTGILRLPRRPHLRIPEGDIVVPLERAFTLLASAMRRAESVRLPQMRLPSIPQLDHAERALARWPIAGATLLLASGAMALAIT